MHPITPVLPGQQRATRFSGFFKRNIEKNPIQEQVPGFLRPEKTVVGYGKLALNTLSAQGNLDTFQLQRVEPSQTWYGGKFFTPRPSGMLAHQGTLGGLTVEVVDPPPKGGISRGIAVYKTGQAGRRGTIIIWLQNLFSDYPRETTIPKHPIISVMTQNDGKTNSELIYQNREKVWNNTSLVWSAFDAYDKLLPLLKKIDEIAPDPEWAAEKDLEFEGGEAEPGTP